MIKAFLGLILSFIGVALFTIVYLKFWIWFMITVKTFLIWLRKGN